MALAAGSMVRAAGRSCRLGPLLKSGGAGSVYPLAGWPGVVAKVYHEPFDRAGHERKVAAMLELSPNLPDIEEDGRRHAQIAWPEALLHDGDGRFAGFVMPMLDLDATRELECVLQERQALAEGLPTGLGAKVTLAANLAGVIAELHRQGHHVVDLKPVNVRFHRNALYMAVIDCDGFSIQGRGERFAGQHVTPDYLAPEFQRQPIHAAVEEQQDRFALAVVVFQLLNFGIHPYTGRPANDRVSTDIPGRIAEHCYAYGFHANARMAPGPASGHRAMPSDLRLLFDRAFGGKPEARPSAADWASALAPYAQRANQRVVACTRDPGHQHFAGLPCAACARVDLLALARLHAPAAREALSRRVATVAAAARKAPASAHVHPGTVWPRTGAGPASPVPLARASAPPARPQPPVFQQRPRAGAGAPTGRWIVPVVWVVVMGAIRTFAGSDGSFTQSPTYVYSPPDHGVLDAPVADVPPELLARHPPGFHVDVDATLARPSVEAAARAMAGNDRAEQAKALAALQTCGSIALHGNGGIAQSYGVSETSAGRSYLGKGARVIAFESFVRAICADPDNADAWYGYAVSADNDEQTVGAVARAEGLAPDAWRAQVRREAFDEDLMRRAGIDPQRFATLAARGRVLATQAGRADVPARVAAPSARHRPRAATP